MKGRVVRWSALCAALTVLGGAACGITEPDLQTVGTVRFDEVEGGCWGILTAEDRYEPTNLAEEFRVDGLRVRFEANFAEMASPCMIGPMIDLIHIEPIP